MSKDDNKRPGAQLVFNVIEDPIAKERKQHTPCMDCRYHQPLKYDNGKDGCGYFSNVGAFDVRSKMMKTSTCVFFRLGDHMIKKEPDSPKRVGFLRRLWRLIW